MKFLSAITITLALTAMSFAQSPSKVLQRAEKAIGGKKAVLAVRSATRSGTIRRVSDGSEGRITINAAQPNFYNLSFDIGGFETEYGYNGRWGWMRDSRSGMQTLTGKASIDAAAKASFRNFLWLRYKDEKSKITSGGTATVNGKPANVVLLTTQKGVVIKLYFDAANSLFVREDIPSGDGIESIEYSDHRDNGGIKQPYSMRITTGGETYDAKFDEVKLNINIAESQFNFPVISGAPLPDIPKLLADLQANEDRVEDLLESYSYTQKVIKRELGKDGILREKSSETNQLSFYKGKRITRLIEKNGVPLSASEQAKEDREAAEKVEELEKQAAKDEERLGKQGSNGAPSNEGRRISIAEVLRASKLINPRRERFRGRDVIVFDFEPNPDFDLSKAKSMLKFFGKTAGVMWIDENDKQVARLEAALFESIKVGGGFLAKLQKGATFTLEQDRVNNEIWLPSQADINLAVRVLLVKGVNVNQIVKSYDYSKFETEVKDAKVTESNKP